MAKKRHRRDTRIDCNTVRSITRTRKLLLYICGTASILVSISVVANAATTIERGIADLDSDNRLEYVPGSEFDIRVLGADVMSSPDRSRVRKRLIHFGHLTDIHVNDEESPATAEAADGIIPPSYRPQEALTAQVGTAMVESLRDARSPIDGAAVENYVVTGDAVNNIQLNETRAYINVLNGGRVNPDSGDPDAVEQTCPGVDVGVAPAPRYDGIDGGTDRWAGVKVGFYDPDGPSDDPLIDDDGPGYSELEAQNRVAKRRRVAVRNFPGLFQAAQLPFVSTGLDAPWYTVFGNHDGLVLGTLIGPYDPDFLYDQPVFGPIASSVGTDEWASFPKIDELARGCRKWFPGDPLELPFLPPDKWTREPPDGDGDGEPDDWTAVPPDPQRTMLNQQQWIAQHFDADSETPNVPDGHGFAEVTEPGSTYYSLSPKPGIRYIGLDTINRVFFAEGAMRDDQFRWLESELQKATRAGEQVIVFGHHTLATISNAFDTNPPTEGPYHFGLRDERGTPEQAERLESLEELFLRYPNVIAYVSGHEHRNYVEGYSDTLSGAAFWEISTAAHIDWPQQARLIEVFDNCDSTISIFGSLVDHVGGPDPGNPDLSFPSGEGDPVILASISREISFNDWQGATGEDGQDDAGGGLRDRNVELVLRNPVSRAAICPPPDTGQEPEAPASQSPASDTASQSPASDTAGGTPIDEPDFDVDLSEPGKGKRTGLDLEVSSNGKAIKEVKFGIDRNMKLSTRDLGKKRKFGEVSATSAAGTEEAALKRPIGASQKKKKAFSLKTSALKGLGVNIYHKRFTRKGVKSFKSKRNKKNKTLKKRTVPKLRLSVNQLPSDDLTKVAVSLNPDETKLLRNLSGKKTCHARFLALVKTEDGTKYSLKRKLRLRGKGCGKKKASKKKRSKKK